MRNNSSIDYFESFDELCEWNLFKPLVSKSLSPSLPFELSVLVYVCRENDELYKFVIFPSFCGFPSIPLHDIVFTCSDFLKDELMLFFSDSHFLHLTIHFV